MVLRSEDVQYIESLTRHLLATYPEVSRDAVYAWGYSNGAFLSLVRTTQSLLALPPSLAVRMQQRRCVCAQPPCMQRLRAAGLPSDAAAVEHMPTEGGCVEG